MPRPDRPRATAPDAAAPGRSAVYPRTKRAVDVLVAGLCLLVLAPVMLAVALLVRLSSPGPALFRQVRVGQDGHPFEMYKFRTMRVGCSDAAHREYVTRMLSGDAGANVRDGLYKLTDDRVTRLGAVLRRTSLDELPQLVNVLRGDMSLVGPRPMLPWEVELLPPAYRARHAVPGGITGLWQVSGRSALTMTQAIELDLEYVRTRSLTLDLRILARTAATLASPRGSAR